MPRAPGRCVTDRLSAFLDGDLPALQAQAVRAHVEACAACARAAAEMQALIAAARSLDRPEPPPTLWPAIAGGLDRLEGAAGRPEARPRRWIELWRPFGVGALAGAAAVAAVVIGLRGAPPPGPPPARERVAVTAGAAVDPLLEEAEGEFVRAAAAYERSIEKLRLLLAREEARWSADERVRHAERLARLDDAIARSRELARRTPGDSAGNHQLFAAYQEKIAFMTAAVHRGGSHAPEDLGR